jgi:hypothetical protein
MRNHIVKDQKHDARLLRESASKMEEMNLGGASPFWRFVVRPKLETGLKSADQRMLRRLRKLDSREYTTELLVRRLRRLATEYVELAS